MDMWQIKMESEDEDCGCEQLRIHSPVNNQKNNYLLHDVVQSFKKLTTSDNRHKIYTNNQVEEDRLQEINNILNMPMDFFYDINDTGSTLLISAIEEGHMEAACWLILNAPHPSYLDIQSNEFPSPLHAALATRQSHLVRELVIAGANLRYTSQSGSTLLHEVCVIGDLRCLRALVDPFSSEERSRLADQIRSCLGPYCNLESYDYFGKTPLHVAVTNGQTQLVEYLVAVGADVNAADGLAGNTPLHIAAEYGSTELAEILMRQSNCQVDAVNYAGLTAYQVALGNRNQNFADAFRGQINQLRRCPSNSSLGSDSGFSSSSDDCSTYIDLQIDDA